MAYTAPTAAVSLGTLTVTQYNTDIKENIEFLYSAGTATQGSVTATQGSVTATQGSVVTLAGSVTNIITQPIGTAITSAATAGSIYPVTTADTNKLLICASTASGTISIPNNATQGFAIGQKIDLAQMGTGTVTVVGTVVGGTTVNIRSTPSAILRTQYSAASVIKIGTDEWLLMGDLY